MVHAGPNTHDGGLKNGLLSVLYQVGMAGVVKRAPTIPTDRQPRIETIAWMIFLVMCLG